MSKALPMTQAIETITPNRAEQWLKLNVDNNRAIVKTRVDAYVEAIRAGRWLLTPEGVMFDTQGRLIDGQHRLTAIAQAGTPVKMVVWRNVPFDVMSVVNTGVARSLADVLTVTGAVGVQGAPKVAVARATAVNLIFHPEQGTKKLRPDQYERVIENFGSDIEWTLTSYPNNGGSMNSTLSRKVRSVMVMGALAVAHKKFPGPTEMFADRLDTGLELKEGDPAHALRRYLDGITLTGGGAPRLTVAHATFRAAYAALKNERIGILKTAYFTGENPEFLKILRAYEVVE